MRIDFNNLDADRPARSPNDVTPGRSFLVFMQLQQRCLRCLVNIIFIRSINTDAI